MALTEELKEIYSSNPVGTRYYESVAISHSRFSKTYYMVQDSVSHEWKLEDDSTVTFEPFGFSLVLPEVGGAQQSIQFVFDNVGREAMPELEAAAELISEPIQLHYRVYIDGSDISQYDISLVMTNIVADNYSISAIATRPDLYARTIPKGNAVFFDSKFRGLYLK